MSYWYNLRNASLVFRNPYSKICKPIGFWAFVWTSNSHPSEALR